MNTRRKCINLAAERSTIAAAMIQGSAHISVASPAEGKAQETKSNSAKMHYKPPFKFVIGGVPIGNEFAVVTDKDAYAAIEAEWDAVLRYFDTAPWYGLGLAERRYGNFLHDKPRNEFIVSSKVGKLLKASKNYKRDLFPFCPSPNDVAIDHTGPGVRRSIEDSVPRLGLNSLDIVFVHDISSDNKLLPTAWPEQF